MSEPDARQQPEPQPPESLELPFFDSEIPAPPRVTVVLDRQQPLRRLPPESEKDLDSDCACQ